MLRGFRQRSVGIAIATVRTRLAITRTVEHRTLERRRKRSKHTEKGGWPGKRTTNAPHMDPQRCFCKTWAHRKRPKRVQQRQPTSAPREAGATQRALVAPCVGQCLDVIILDLFSPGPNKLELLGLAGRGPKRVPARSKRAPRAMRAAREVQHCSNLCGVILCPFPKVRSFRQVHPRNNC